MVNEAKEPESEDLDGIGGRLHTEEPEALFSVAEVRKLRLASHYHRPSVSDFLAHQVARDPADLRRHVQRIGVFLTKGDGSRAYGAIVDLFIALGEKGIALRRRMLDSVRPLLSGDQSRALDEKLQRGLSPLDRIPLSSESILGKSIRGTTQLVDRIAMHGTSAQDLLEEARSHLEYGQVDEARRVLEEAMLQDPEREDVHKELLEIYARSKDHALFSSMLQALRFTGNPIPVAWQRFATDLGLDNSE